jgi:hypothetical protein
MLSMDIFSDNESVEKEEQHGNKTNQDKTKQSKNKTNL